jgi:hypothetical protein
VEGAGWPADRLRRRLAAVALACWAGVAASPRAGQAAGHDLHLSHTRLLVDGATVTARVRVFEDDLARALGITTAGAAPTDAQLVAYIERHLLVRADGTVLRGPTLGGAGREVDGQGQPVRWVLVTWRAARPIGTLALRVALLFETFGDQQNIVIAARGTGEERRTLSFQAGDTGEQVVRF